jgi:hypothetical protein
MGLSTNDFARLCELVNPSSLLELEAVVARREMAIRGESPARPELGLDSNRQVIQRLVGLNLALKSQNARLQIRLKGVQNA